jgi:hypothetical protein
MTCSFYVDGGNIRATRLKNKMAEVNHRKESQMHLNEFADPKDYALTVADAEEFRDQLLLIWPDRAAVLLAPSTLHNGRQPPTKPR